MKISIRPVRIYRETDNPIEHYPKNMYSMYCIIQTPEYKNYANTCITLQFKDDGSLLDYTITDACPHDLHLMICEHVLAQTIPLQQYMMQLKLKLILDQSIQYDDCTIKLQEV